MSDPEPLSEVELAELADALYSALCFDEKGKQRTWRERVDALATAEWQARFLRDSCFVVLRRSSARRVGSG
jgi:hypothetical protein